MFSILKKNSPFYILDKGDNISLRAGSVDTVSAVKYTNALMPTVDITVNTGEGTVNFNELPANLTVATKDNIIVSESREDMLKEVESLMTESKKVLDSVEYHKNALELYNKMLPVLNPTLSEKIEQEKRINALEEKFSQIESGVTSMKDMISQILTKINS